MSNKPTQIEVLEALMSASQMAGQPINMSLEDASAILEAIKIINDAIKTLHKHNGGPLTSAQLMDFIASNLGYFIGCQVTEESKIPLLVIQSTRVIMESALQTQRIIEKGRR